MAMTGDAAHIGTTVELHVKSPDQMIHQTLAECMAIARFIAWRIQRASDFVGSVGQCWLNLVNLIDT